MAQTSKKKAPPKKVASKKKEVRSEAKENKKEEIIPSQRIINQIMPAVLVLIAIYIVICYLISGSTGVFGVWIKNFLYGLFSYGAWAIPVLLVVRAFSWKNDADTKCLGVRITFSVLFVVGVSMLVHVFGGAGLGFSIPALYRAGMTLTGGGVIGGLISGLLLNLVGVAGTLIINFALVFVCGMFMLGITPYMIWLRVMYSIRKNRDRMREREEEYANEQSEKERLRKQTVLTKKSAEKSNADIDDAIDFDEENSPEPIDVDIFNKVLEEEEDDDATTIDENYNSPFITKVTPETPSKRVRAQDDPHAVDLDALFGDDEKNESDELFDDILENTRAEEETRAELTVERRNVGTMEEKKEEKPVHQDYKFPPITLLKKDTSVKNQDVTEELRQTATKLVETLKSYKINTKLVSISRGPSITRYELSPEIGTKVNSIVNRIDDISLHLATTGVRIVAPIPGMEAVGVEVPNKNVSLVYIRELLENEEFKRHPSKIHVALGMDVTGRPIFMDIAKMPHLLIAGATGMGKSVCINSTIISILYKSTPDEVKLILIDPKQVEFTMYDGIPHLLVPVVTDPKKAAGTLHWAVTEMERRYELINGASVRNIHGYNEKMKDDPDAEYMPQIVIIIDELADLMLTASNDVDESIRRLSAKARAAGIHLILGTQRPSVDVITGTIKSNIPYRIAFTTTSYVDSRTILDVAGAEKLIGKGDMLYAATGKSPIRVQGSFVSDDEVSAITDFVKTNCGGANYNKQVVESIEREAELCGNKKSTTLGDGELDNNSGDPLLKAAIEIAVDAGKISTSLLQRKLSIGFGRAAKIIDIMEQRGIVSEPDGQKPRTTLWTREQYMESIVKGSSYDLE